MKKIVIVGSDLVALLCSYIFMKYDVEVLLVVPDKIEDKLVEGGLQYVYYTDAMATIFEELDLMYSDFSITGGILLRGNVEEYPRFFRSKKRKPQEVDRIKIDYYKKTRLVEASGNVKKAIPDLLETTRPRKAIRTDFESMTTELERRIDTVRARPLMINDQSLLTSKGRIEFDNLVLTIPLWQIRDCVNWYVPCGVAMKLNAVSVVANRDQYSKWDYVLTPYTPANHVHRFFSSGMQYTVEVNGGLSWERLHSDLNFLFGDGWYVQDVKEGLRGFLLPVEAKAQWPRSIAPLGRFAKWDSAVTLDGTLNEIISLARRWFS